MSYNTKAALLSKLMVYLTCYQAAEKRKDQKRMDQFETYISDLREEINNYE